jgi:hypothetical protein
MIPPDQKKRVSSEGETCNGLNDSMALYPGKARGHKKLTTTQIYLHTHEDELRAAAERLNRLPTRSGPQKSNRENTALANGAGEVDQKLFLFGLVGEQKGTKRE